MGSFLVAVILKTQDTSNNFTLTTKNESLYLYDYVQNCGFSNCPDTILPESTSKSTQHSIYVFIGIMIFLCLVSVLVTLVFVDNVSVAIEDGIEEKHKNSVGKMLKQEFANLFNLTKSIDFYLLIPIGIYAGFELTFMWSEFNRVK